MKKILNTIKQIFIVVGDVLDDASIEDIPIIAGLLFSIMMLIFFIAVVVISICSILNII